MSADWYPRIALHQPTTVHSDITVVLRHNTDKSRKLSMRDLRIRIVRKMARRNIISINTLSRMKLDEAPSVQYIWLLINMELNM